MAKPSRDIMNELLGKTTQQLLDIIEKGVPVINKDGDPVIDPATGEVLRNPAAPAYFTAAITLLKNTGIELDPGGSEIGKFKTILSDMPFDAPSKFDRYQ